MEETLNIMFFIFVVCSFLSSLIGFGIFFIFFLGIHQLYFPMLIALFSSSYFAILFYRFMFLRKYFTEYPKELKKVKRK